MHALAGSLLASCLRFLWQLAHGLHKTCFFSHRKRKLHFLIFLRRTQFLSPCRRVNCRVYFRECVRVHGFFESTPPPSVKVSSRHLFVSPMRSVDMHCTVRMPLTFTVEGLLSLSKHNTEIAEIVVFWTLKMPRFLCPDLLLAKLPWLSLLTGAVWFVQVNAIVYQRNSMVLILSELPRDLTFFAPAYGSSRSQVVRNCWTSSMLLKSRTQWSTLSNSHGYSNRQTKWSAYMYSDICMCVLYTYTLQSSVSWSGVPVQMRVKVFFFSSWLSWFHHIFCVHKDSPANVTANDCMNVHVRIVWVCICASVEFANNPDGKVSKHAE